MSKNGQKFTLLVAAGILGKIGESFDATIKDATEYISTNSVFVLDYGEGPSICC